MGGTVTNALSTVFEIESRRPAENQIHSIRFENGKSVSDKKKANPKGLHGTKISMIPNEKYLGRGAKFDLKEFRDWIDDISYLLGSSKKKITTHYCVMNGTTQVEKDKIKSVPFSNMIYKICEKPIMDPIIIERDANIDEEDINGKFHKKKVHLEVALCYDAESDVNEITKVISYCNYTKTTNGGVHESAVDEAICRTLQTATKQTLSDKEKEKIDILWSDIRTDLRVVINLSSNAQVQFVGNAKKEIGNKNLIPVIKDMVISAINEFAQKNVTTFSMYTKFVKKNAKARIELSKIKTVSTKPKTDNFADRLNEAFTPCNNTGKQYKELYLIEGKKSAAGSVIDGRNANVQAVLGFRGNTKNAYKTTVNTLFQNEEWKQYFNLIGYDIKKANVDDIKYDKIIISTDADTDGSGIAASIGACHAKYALPLVEAGKLYRVYPPLYQIKDTKSPFVRTKKELVDHYLNKILSNYQLWYDMVGDDKFSKSDFKHFVYDTEFYLARLQYVADHYFVSRTFVEIVGFHVVMYAKTKIFKDKLDGDYDAAVKKELNSQKFITTLMSDLQKIYPELVYDNKASITGPVDGSFQTLRITSRFLQRMYDEFGPIWNNYGLYLKYKEGDGKKEIGTIGMFLQASSKYRPTIVQRFKGLGEADWEDISKTIMDPKKRILVQLTVNDVKRDLLKIQMLFDDSEDAKKYRKKLMKNHVVDPDEIDT